MLLVMPFSETPPIQLWHLTDPSVLTNVCFAPEAAVPEKSVFNHLGSRATYRTMLAAIAQPLIAANCE